MKLYTEQELRKHLYNHDERFFEDLTPIELPSDEQINEKAEEFELTGGTYAFKEAIKWYKEQLKSKL